MVTLKFEPGEKVMIHGGKIRGIVIGAKVYVGEIAYVVGYWDNDDKYTSVDLYDFHIEKE